MSQSKTQSVVDSAVPISRVVTLGSVRFVEGRFGLLDKNNESEEPAVWLPGQLFMKEGRNAAVEHKAASGRLFVKVELSCEAYPDKERRRNPVFGVQAEFGLAYGLPPDFEPSPAQLQAFASTNAVFNAWPYWREYVQSCCARLNIGPITVPLFRLPAVPTSKPSKASPSRRAASRKTSVRRGKTSRQRSRKASIPE